MVQDSGTRHSYISHVQVTGTGHRCRMQAEKYKMYRVQYSLIFAGLTKPDIHVETKNQVLYSWISCDKYIIACHLNCWTSTWNWMGVSDQKERWTCSCRSIYRKWWSSRQILFKLYFRPCGASWNKYITWLFSLVFASQYLDRPQLQNAAWCRNFAVKLKVAL